MSFWIDFSYRQFVCEWAIWFYEFTLENWSDVSGAVFAIPFQGLTVVVKRLSYYIQSISFIFRSDQQLLILRPPGYLFNRSTLKRLCLFHKQKFLLATAPYYLQSSNRQRYLRGSSPTWTRNRTIDPESAAKPACSSQISRYLPW